MLTAFLSLALAASDAQDVAAHVKRGQAFAVTPDATWTEGRYNVYSDDVVAWRREAEALQARPTLARKDALKLLEARAAVAERYAAVLAAQPVPQGMQVFGDRAVSVWKDAIGKWIRSLTAEAGQLRAEAKALAAKR